MVVNMIMPSASHSETIISGLIILSPIYITSGMAATRV